MMMKTLKINLEGELLAALEELSFERKKHEKTSKRLVDVEEMVVILKVELEENKRIHEELEAQLVLKTEENNKLEEEVIGLKTQMEKLSQKLNAYQGSSKLNEILNAQRPPHLKFGLGFEGESSSKQVKEAPQKTKQIAVNVTPPKAISQTQKPKRKLAPPKKMPQPQNFRPPMRIQSTNFRSISHFHGYCFKCNTYGHKMMTCKFNLRPRNFVNRNSFDALMMYPIECFICHNFGHLARNCVYAHDFN